MSQKISSESEIQVGWREVKNAYLAIVDEKKPLPAQWPTNTLHAQNLMDWQRNPNQGDTWGGDGASPADTVRWARKGFDAPEFRNAARYVEAAPKKKRTYNDTDGGLDLDRLMSGEPEFFVKRKKKPIRAGLKINVKLDFHAGVDAKIIRTYGAWIAGLVGAIEAQGFDMEVNVTNKATHVYQEDGYDHATAVNIRVKKFGEKSRLAGWSVLFAPTGFRQIVFTALYVAGEKDGRTPTSGLGSPTSSSWGVEYDTKTNIVTINCDSGARKCDLDKLNADAKTARLL